MATTNEPGKPKLAFGLELEFSILVIPDEFPKLEKDTSCIVYGITRTAGSEPTKLEGNPCITVDEKDKAYHELCIKWTTNAQHFIAKFLTSFGIPAYADFFLDDATVANKDTLYLENYQQKRWKVASDETINNGILGKYALLGIELNSPPYLLNEDSLDEVRKVLGLLSHHFKIMCDFSSSIHVHIGNEANGFDLDTMKSLMMLCYSFEPQLSTIHPPMRSTGPYPENWTEPYSNLMRTHSLLSIWLRSAAKPVDSRFALDKILACSTMDELIFWMGLRLRHAQSVYSIENLASHLDSFKKTIEFRQHKSDLDHNAVTNWIRLCGSLLQTATTINPQRMANYCEQYMTKSVSEFSIVNVLMFIKEPELAKYFGMRRYYPGSKNGDEHPLTEARFNKLADDVPGTRRYVEMDLDDGESEDKVQKEKDEGEKEDEEQKEDAQSSPSKHSSS